jgi:tRNA(Ile)-lysidine synthase
VVVAVSGGADSTALLLALEELKRAGLLGVELTAAHLNHGLRGESAEEDARFAESLARAHGFEFVSARADVGRRVSESGDNLEQAARRARYEFLSEAARRVEAAAVLTGHTLDDQAETVLLRLLRGSGSEGLGGMRPERSLEEGGRVLLRRPLLEWARRADTEGYCRARGVEFRADEMNEDERFARVRVRRALLPLLETFNPRAAETIARAAGLLREESSALEGFAARLLEDAPLGRARARGLAPHKSRERRGGRAPAEGRARRARRGASGRLARRAQARVAHLLRRGLLTFRRKRLEKYAGESWKRLKKGRAKLKIW